MKSSLLLTAAASLLLSSAAWAENWSNWRGPAQNGTMQASGLPTKFSKSEGIKWSVDMPGASSATPAIWGDDIFVSSTDEEKEELLALCLDRETGEEKWRETLGKGLFQDNRSNFSGPSPTTDGNVVVFFYGTGDMAALSLDGEVLWQKNIQEAYEPFYFLWTFSTSPLLHNGSVILQVLQRDTPVHKFQEGGKSHDSYLVAFDAKTGKEQWKVKRNSEAIAEAKEAFSTPVIYTLENGKEILLVSGGDVLTGHDSTNGKELWRWGTYNPEEIKHWRLVPSPVAGAGVALVCAPKKAPVYAVDAATGDLLWVSEDPAISSDVPTPAFLDGKFYVLSDVRKSLSCVDAKTGEVHWTSELETRSKFEASPTIADGKIYMMNHAGEVFVAAASPEQFTLLHRAEMGEGRNQENRSSVAIAGGNLFIRTDDTLFCVGE